jgi:type VI secretion system protein ImpA
LRRRPFLSNPQLGAFSLRHFEIAAGRLPATADDGEPPSAVQLTAVLSATDGEELAPLEASLTQGVAALQQIDSAMRAANGHESGPDFEPLLAQLEQARDIVAIELASRAAAAAGAAAGVAAGSGGAIAVGGIKSRDDAVRALDAVADFFRRNEPSSPVPLFVERAKRLIAKDFLEVLADIAPDGLDQAKRIGGVRNE